VTLHYLHDLSIADMAVAMDCAEGTAKAHLHKARTALAAHLDKDPT
jgi:DNA-directed RNA polymerase specialized sigma24 family protein